jgi:hypothetical protein
MLVLLALAMILLEAERWWTRRRRRQRRQVGASAYMLDGLSVTSAALAVASALTLLAHAIVAAVVFAGTLLGWAGNRVLALTWLPAVLVAAVAFGAVAFAFTRGWLRLPGRISSLPAPTQSPAPEHRDLLTPATMLSQRHEPHSVAEIPMTAPSAIVVAPATAPQMTVAPRSALSITPAARAEGPVEGLASVSMIGQHRRPMPAAPPPASFLTDIPLVEQPRSRLRLAVVALAIVVLAGSTLFFWQPLAGLMPSVAPEANADTAPAPRNAPTPATNSTAPARPAPAAIFVHVKSNVLNLRAGPGTDQQVLMTLRRGDQVLLLKETQTIAGRTWVKVQSGEQAGWVSQEFLE